MNEDNVESVDGTSRTDMLAMLNRLHIKDQEIIRIKNEKEQEIIRIQNEKDQEVFRKDQEIIRIKNEKDQDVIRKDQEIIRIQNEKDQEIIRLKNEKDQEIIMLKHENECLKIKLKFPKEEKQKLDIFNNLTMPSKSKGGVVKISQMDPLPVLGIISDPRGNQNRTPQSVSNAHREQEQTQWSFHNHQDQDNCSSFDFYNDRARDNGSSHPFYAGGTQESPSSLKFIRNNGTWKMGNEKGEKKSKRLKRNKNKEDKKIKKSKRHMLAPAQYENNTNNLAENPKENNNASQVPVHKMDTEDELNNIIRKQVSVSTVPPVRTPCLKIKLKLPTEEKQKLNICNNLTMPSQSKGGNLEDQESGSSQFFCAGGAQENGSLQPSHAGGAQESQSPQGFYTDDACEPAPKLPIISPVDIWKQHNAQQKNPRTISVEEFEDVATFPQSEITIKTEVMYDESEEIVPNQENGENMLDTSFCEEVVPSRKNTYGPEWTMMQPNLLELKQEEGLCTDEQNKAVELMAVSHGGGEQKKIKVYNCSLCDREMTNASSIVSHIQSKHGEGGKKKMRCIFPLCEHSAYREDLIRHIRAKHTKEELFECKKCFKKFYTYRAMKDHVENHRYQDMCRKCNRFYRHDKCGFCKDSM